jgi:hypothetical protein
MEPLENAGRGVRIANASASGFNRYLASTKLKQGAVGK